MRIRIDGDRELRRTQSDRDYGRDCMLKLRIHNMELYNGLHMNVRSADPELSVCEPYHQLRGNGATDLRLIFSGECKASCFQITLIGLPPLRETAEATFRDFSQGERTLRPCTTTVKVRLTDVR